MLSNCFIHEFVFTECVWLLELQIPFPLNIINEKVCEDVWTFVTLSHYNFLTNFDETLRMFLQHKGRILRPVELIMPGGSDGREVLCLRGPQVQCAVLRR